MSGIRHMMKTVVATVIAVGLSACSDGFFHDPSTAGSVQLAITASQADGATAAFDKADNIDVRIEDRSSGRSLFQGTVDVSGGGGPIRTSIEVDLKSGDVDARMELEVRRGNDQLFVGASDLSLVPGRETDVSVALAPVPESLDVPEIPLFTVFGEVFPLESAVLFATGDPIPGADVEWESLSPTVLTVEAAPGGGYQARALTDGAGTLRAVFGTQAADVQADVRAVVVSAEVEPSSAGLAPGQSIDLDVLHFDAGGSEVPGRTSEWVSSDESVATVTDEGTVMAVGIGTVDVTATHEGVSASAVITVRDPSPGVSAPRTQAITVNGATVTATVDPRGLSTTVWFEYGVDPTLSTSQQTATVTLPGSAGPTDVTELLMGLLDNTTYYVRVVAVNALGRTEGMIISFTTLDAPDAPSGLTANLTPGGVGLSWTDNSTSETRFEIERRMAGGGTGTIIASPGADVQQYVDLSAPDAALEYRVRACNANGCSAWSSPALVSSSSLAPGVTTVAPSPISLTSATLRASIDARGFNTTVRFEYGTDSALAGATQTSALFVPSSSTTASVTHPLTGLTPNTVYYVRAVGISQRGRTDGNIVSFTTRDRPTAPTGLTATLGLNGGVRLAWIDQSSDETSFEVEREEVVGGQRTTLSASADAQLLVDTAAPPGLLRYRIRSCNSAGCSAWSAAVVITVPNTGPLVTTLAPQGVVSNAATLQASVDPQGLTADVWFLVSTSPGMGGATPTPTTTLAAGTPAGIVTEALTGLTESTTYYVQAIAVNARGRTNGAVVSFTTPVLPPAPAAPTGLTVGTSPGGGIQLDWTDNSTTTGGFEIEVQVGGGSPTTVATPAGTTQFIDDAPPTGLLQYRVRACNAGGCSAFSAPVQWFFGLPPEVVLDATTNVGSFSADLNAQVNALNDATTVIFVVARDPGFSTSLNFPSVPLDAGTGASLAPVTTTATGLDDGVVYYVRVEATNRWGTTVSATGTFTTSGG